MGVGGGGCYRKDAVGSVHGTRSARPQALSRSPATENVCAHQRHIEACNVGNEQGDLRGGGVGCCKDQTDRARCTCVQRVDCHADPACGQWSWQGGAWHGRGHVPKVNNNDCRACTVCRGGAQSNPASHTMPTCVAYKKPPPARLKRHTVGGVAQQRGHGCGPDVRLLIICSRPGANTTGARLKGGTCNAGQGSVAQFGAHVWHGPMAALGMACLAWDGWSWHGKMTARQDRQITWLAARCVCHAHTTA